MAGDIILNFKWISKWKLLIRQVGSMDMETLGLKLHSYLDKVRIHTSLGMEFSIIIRSIKKFLDHNMRWRIKGWSIILLIMVEETRIFILITVDILRCITQSNGRQKGRFMKNLLISKQSQILWWRPKTYFTNLMEVAETRMLSKYFLFYHSLTAIYFPFRTTSGGSFNTLQSNYDFRSRFMASLRTYQKSRRETPAQYCSPTYKKPLKASAIPMDSTAE